MTGGQFQTEDLQAQSFHETNSFRATESLSTGHHPPLSPKGTDIV